MPAGPDDERASADESGESGELEPAPADNGDTGDSARTVANESAVSEQDTADEEWRFSVEDVSASDEPPEDEPESDDDGNIAGSLAIDDHLEPGDIDRENALFVALGVLIVIALIAGAVLGL